MPDRDVERHRFYKTSSGSWYIDLPEWKGAIAELQMVAGADTLLDKVSKGKDEVYVEISTKPTEGFETLKLVEVKQFGGADYVLEHFQNKRVYHQMWLCDVTMFVFNSFPERVFFKVLE